MQRISELKVSKEITQIKRDAQGNEHRINKSVKVPFQVNTIQGSARFGHYLIDLFVIILISVGLDYAGISGFTNIQVSNNSFSYFINIHGYLLVFIYYTVLESTMGKTLGKFATNAIVIDDFGNKPEVGTIMIRSISRLIPFETFSCLGKRGWHDTISKTYVVNEEELVRIKRALGESDFSDDYEILD